MADANALDAHGPTAEPLRILYANVIEGNAGWGAEWFTDRALRALGHTTHCFDYRVNRRRIYQSIRQAPECDGFLLQRGEKFPLPAIAALSVPRVYWASELISRRRDQHRLVASGLFDHIFFRTPDCIDRVVERGWCRREQCSIMLSAFDPELHSRSTDTKKDIDILFVGRVTPRRQRILDKIRASVDVTVASAYGKDMIGLFNRARVVLNIHSEEHLDTETRVFEALGSGAFLLSEALSEENPFHDTHLVQCRAEKELVEKSVYYLAHEDERVRIADDGYRAAHAAHTYHHRARQIAETIHALRDVRPRRERMVMRGLAFRAASLGEALLRLVGSSGR